MNCNFQPCLKYPRTWCPHLPRETQRQKDERSNVVMSEWWIIRDKRRLEKEEIVEIHQQRNKCQTWEKNLTWTEFKWHNNFWWWFSSLKIQSTKGLQDKLEVSKHDYMREFKNNSAKLTIFNLYCFLVLLYIWVSKGEVRK